MFRWYRNATRCYVYLSDVPSPPSGTSDEFNPQSWDSDFGKANGSLGVGRSKNFLPPIRSRSSLASIPTSALQGAPLSRFSVDERFFWIGCGETKLEEDKVYSLLGILDVKMSLFYGEGGPGAFKRVREIIDKREKCIQDLRLTDPRDDKRRIVETKGGLLKDSYYWILETPSSNNGATPGRAHYCGSGATPIDNRDGTSVILLLPGYRFAINNATAVLRGLIRMLVGQQPSLVSRIQKKYDHAGKALFEDANAWAALSEIFANILQDPSMDTTT
ncbi:uncharacterized protein Z519_06756 [Cladophialophora bantiana CBS 173.52]|uniref:Uncharacterized protein n=1 Tax=Cladophialophora bantiana (strain ATCC 10958 / CBS 173.52 / CDC B-1940 / NIH 8579) TaxID=1442370 RepID=A0A0D2G2G3_CLAB1|nr:uncharacterized protein Z519_06756 [Cladophialophora bantiana CBS 173.52]KIW92907.1 hypothetical protein Z519_06756 [Cladophialophora bantiana CBS 173.52]